MRKIISVLSLAMFGFIIALAPSCKKEPQQVIVKNSRGYNCVNYTCTLVEENAQYVTLTDCKGDCVDRRPGSAQIQVIWTGFYNYDVVIGLAETAEDIAIDAYMVTVSGYTTPVVLNKTELAAGTYYYRVTARQSGSYTYFYKSGKFTVTAGQQAQVTISL